MQKLTKEQAIVISGFTGIVACNFSLLHEDVEKRLGRPFLTHEFATERETVRELYREDFLKLCYIEQKDTN